MARRITTTAVTALCCVALGSGLVACDEMTPKASGSSSASPTDAKPFSGTKKISVEGHSVNVSCSGDAVDGKPVVVMMAGLGDKLTKMADFQKSVSKEHRVCSFDRLGQGASDKPTGPQTVADSGKIVTGVLDQVAGESPVVLAGHSLGGLLAARYAPDHQDKVKGLVLMDATSPTTTADISGVIPASAEAPADELRAGTLAVNKGENPEMLILPDGKVASAGDIPVEVIQHGVRYLGEVPTYGDDLETVWTEGQHKWLGVSTDSKLSTAEKSGHEIYVDRPDLALKAVQSVTAEVAG
ncbi:alpha/beta fold hydrolase [Streptomyces sp. NPDC048565]|uniref:alpha/beta fold hydrolase n=1 Tax=Streptomyces sp. NPDC048565 TaxID=3155266 RepID=UPI003418F01A